MTTKVDGRPAVLMYQSSAQPVKSTFYLRVPISFPGALLTYTFGTDAFDIGFSLTFESSHSEIVLVPESRVSSHSEPVVGTFKFVAAGGFAVLK